jgi:hypothetical protein
VSEMEWGDAIRIAIEGNGGAMTDTVEAWGWEKPYPGSAVLSPPHPLEVYS